jgi:hypothetical protein
MSIQHSGYICEKGKTHGKLDGTVSDIEKPSVSCFTYVNSRSFSGVNQLTVTTFSYSSGPLMGIGM